jgi:hypothetical protein
VAPLSDLSDEALQSVAKRSLRYGERARELLKARVNGVVADTRELTGLTADLVAENEVTHRQQLGAPSEQDRALDSLRDMFPS